MLEASNDLGYSVLHTLASRGQFKAILMLLQTINDLYGKETLLKLVLKCDKDGQNLLHNVLQCQDDSESVALLINGLPQHLSKKVLEEMLLMVNKEGHNVLRFAIFLNHSKAIRPIAKGVHDHLGKHILKEIVLKGNENGDTVLQCAASLNRFEALTELIEVVIEWLGKDTLEEMVLQTNATGHTVLQYALDGGHQAVEHLFNAVNHYLNKNILENLLLKYDTKDETLLQYAVVHSTSTTLQTLLKDVQIYLGNEIFGEMALKTDDRGNSFFTLCCFQHRNVRSMFERNEKISQKRNFENADFKRYQKRENHSTCSCFNGKN